MTYSVFTEDRYDVESGWICVGKYEDLAGAISKAKHLVDKSLIGGYKPGMAAISLYDYFMGGCELPEIRDSYGEAPVGFEVKLYLVQRCKEICGSVIEDPNSPSATLRHKFREAEKRQNETFGQEIKVLTEWDPRVDAHEEELNRMLLRT